MLLSLLLQNAYRFACDCLSILYTVIHREDNVNRAHFPEEANQAFYVQTLSRRIFLTGSDNVSCVVKLSVIRYE